VVSNQITSFEQVIIKMRPKKKLKSKSTKAAKVQPSIVEKEPDNPMDFGGIESRDLKKNLGCG